MATERRGWRLSVLEPLAVYAGQDESLRHATWLELFFDLVFVLVLAELAGFLHGHRDPVGLLQFAALFAVVWWIWLSTSYFADLYSTDDLGSQVTVLATMFGVIVLSRTIDGALAGGSLAFGAAVLALRTALTLLHLRARHLRPAAPEFLTYWIGLEVLVTAVWGVSLLVPEPGRYGLWIASFVLGTAGIAAIYLSFENIVVPQASHCNERLGLFTILVLGETVIAVGVGTSATWTPATVALGGLGFLVAVAAWWLYFARYDERVVDWTLQATSEDWPSARQRGLAHIYAHYLVHAGIVAAGVGIALALEAATARHAMDAGGRAVLCLGVAAFLLGSGVSHWMAPESLDSHVVVARLAAVAALALLAVVGPTRSPLVLVAAVAVALVALVAFESIGSGPVDAPTVEGGA